MTRMATNGVVRTLAEAGMEHEVLPHARTMSAMAEADAVGCSPYEVAKTIVLTTPEGYARAVIPASERLDMHRVRDLLGGKKGTRLTTEPELVQAYPEFELGAVPPFGGPAGDRVLVDRKLAECECVVFESGSHDESIRMRTDDLLQLANAELRDITIHH